MKGRGNDLFPGEVATLLEQRCGISHEACDIRPSPKFGASLHETNLYFCRNGRLARYNSSRSRAPGLFAKLVSLSTCI